LYQEYYQSNTYCEIKLELKQAELSDEYIEYIEAQTLQVITNFVESARRADINNQELPSLTLYLPSRFNQKDITNFSKSLSKVGLNSIIEFSNNLRPHRLKLKLSDSEILSYDSSDSKQKEELLIDYYYNLLNSKRISHPVLINKINTLSFKNVDVAVFKAKLMQAVFTELPASQGKSNVNVSGLTYDEINSVVQALAEINLKANLSIQEPGFQPYLNISIAQN
jgi:hypothetical protein